MVPLADILAVTGPRDPLTLRWFLGTPELGWKVAWSDRMVWLYTPLFPGALAYALVGRRWSPPRWSWTLLLLYLPLLVDGSPMPSTTSFASASAPTTPGWQL